jgi:hypothetical protein
MCIDLGQWRPAASHALAAWSYANTIGHVGLAGWACGMQATVAFWDRRPREALLAIRRGQEHITTGPLAVRSHSLAARAWSHHGDVDQTVRAVRAAEDARAQIGNDPDDLHDGIGGLFRWDSTRQEMCASSAYLQVAHLRHEDLDPERLRWLIEQVAVHARRALSASHAAAPGARSVTLETSMTLDMATSHAILGDEQGTRETLASVFDLPAEHRTVPLLYRMGHLRAALTQISMRWAHDLDQQLQDFTRTAPPVRQARPLPPGPAQPSD